MTEPVAYRYRDSEDEEWQVTELDNAPYGSYKYVEPLYADSYEYPRVKMTQGEVDEFEKLADSGAFTTYEALELVHGDRGELNEYENLYKRLFDADFLEAQKNQLEFARAWAYCYPEDIEIIPDKKWFVVVTNPIVHAEYTYLKIDGLKRMDFYAPKSEAHQFNTKEEAEEWTNPLTSALHLPVED